MTRDELFEVAEKVGLGFIRHASDKDIEKFETFAKLVAQHEREACADIAENWNSNGMPRTGVANEIRARGQA
jgi:hypothetical protein